MSIFYFYIVEKEIRVDKKREKTQAGIDRKCGKKVEKKKNERKKRRKNKKKRLSKPLEIKTMK